MVWVKLDDHFDEHPKTISVSLQAIGLLSCALCFCNRNLTDGKVPGRVLRRYCEGDETIIPELLAAGFLEPDGDDFEIHDFADYQPLKVDVLRAREATRNRVRRFRSSSNGVTNGVTNAGVTALVTGPPVPVPKEQRSKNTVAAARLFDHWKSVWGHPRAILTPARTRLVEARLREGYDEDTLRAAIDGSKADEKRWPDRANPSAHTFDLILRDAKHIDAFAALAETNGHAPGQKGFAPRTTSEREQHRAALLAQREGQR